MQTYKQVKEYLSSFINYEEKSFFPYEKSLNLERMLKLLGLLGIHYEQLKVIHIAGTKGKSSTASFCASLLAASGFKVGLYTSPHLFDFRERISIKTKGQIKSKVISKRDLSKITKELKVRLKKIKIPEKLGKVSFFEIYTAIAFKYFLEKKVDFVVLETGLGGRLDATNVVTPLISLITPIDYDHTDKLGKRICDITKEKAGIIKRGVPLICSRQRQSSLKVIKAECSLKSSRAFFLDKDFEACNIRLKKNHTFFDFIFNGSKIENLKIYLKGKHQVENAATSLAALLLLKTKGHISNKVNQKAGLSNCDIRARFEIINKNPLIITDVAHNVSSFSALDDSLKLYFPDKKIILIFACCRDKNAKGMIKKINYSHLILTCFKNERCWEPKELKKSYNFKNVMVSDNTKEAINHALKIYTRSHVIVISGSLFLAAELAKVVNERI